MVVRTLSKIETFFKVFCSLNSAGLLYTNSLTNPPTINEIPAGSPGNPKTVSMPKKQNL